MGKLLATKHPNIKIDEQSGIYYVIQQKCNRRVRSSLKTKNYREAVNLYDEAMRRT